MNINSKEFEKYINKKCKDEGISLNELQRRAGFSKTTIRTHINRGVIGTVSLQRYRSIGIEPTMFEKDSDSSKQMTIEDAEVVKKTWNRNVKAEKASPHIDEEASQLLYEYVDLEKKTQKEIVSKLIKTYLPGMIQMKINDDYTKKTHRELVDENIKKDRRIKELEKALKDKNGGAE